MKHINSKYGEFTNQENVEKNCEAGVAEVPQTNNSEVNQSNSKWNDGSQQSKCEHKCQFCESMCFENKKKQHWHYYSKHFKADILANVDGSRCKLCGYENFKRIELVQHVITCNNLIGQLLQRGEIQKKFKCPLCIKTFGRIHHLNEHLSLVHYKEKKFQCHLCMKSFGRKKHLSEHISLVHYKSKLLQYVNSERLECLLCGGNSQTFSKLSILIRHVGAGHGKIKEILDENANRPTHKLEESCNSKPVEISQSGRDEAIEKTLQEDLNLSTSSIDDLLNSDD